ncbi:glycosyl hydrolase family 18 protein [Paenibacillus daejeonensis]|uniref:glycosyl hydrolase family 18 protein n=1 Tax=Paenibacillus daejeonensis TaxID=135193 RepID=UPI0003686748|nr:glycosyl hydrolase family 18 protein [Paenibacillus daejeonensis]
MKRRRYRQWLAAVAVLGLLVGGWLLTRDMDEADGPVYESSPQPLELTAWLPEWQWETALADADQLGGRLAQLYAFGIYFDSEDQLLISDSFTMAWEALATTYESRRDDLKLTFVNDRILADGTSVQKESALVDRLVATSESRQRHIAEIVELVDRLDAGGAEIDYERIAPETWEPLLLFIGDLHTALQEKGKSLRVVLEPRAPLDDHRLPEGPQYVMMAYNLHGSHNGPGPKADEAMIRRLASVIKGVAGEPVLALATGGFQWKPDGAVTALNEQEAHALAEAHGQEPQRDVASAALSFTYTSADGTYTVWYADGETFLRWIEWTRAEGIDRIALWRMGGLRPDTLHQLQHH